MKLAYIFENSIFDLLNCSKYFVQRKNYFPFNQCNLIRYNDYYSWLQLKFWGIHMLQLNHIAINCNHLDIFFYFGFYQKDTIQNYSQQIHHIQILEYSAFLLFFQLTAIAFFFLNRNHEQMEFLVQLHLLNHNRRFFHSQDFLSLFIYQQELHFLYIDISYPMPFGINTYQVLVSQSDLLIFFGALMNIVYFEIRYNNSQQQYRKLTNRQSLKSQLIQQKMKHHTSQESIVKSIIYGSPVQTSYGLIRSLCSAINSKDHIDKIILYLRTNHNFQKYNKFVYAYRLEYQPDQVFITEEMTKKDQFIEGYNDDTGLTGNGQKLLSLLQKFNVRNVLVIVAIRQKDPLREFNAEHYVQVVKCAKDLLSSLYDKVVMSRSLQTDQRNTGQVFQVVPVKEYQIPLATFVKKEKPLQNPNYVGKQYQKKFQPADPVKKMKIQLKYLNEKIKQLASCLEGIIQNFTQAEDAQAHFAIKYDKNKKVIKIFNMLAFLFSFKSKQQFLNGPMSQYLRSITTRSLTAQMIRKLNQELMSDRSLKSQNIVNQSKICGVLMEFMQVLLNSYSFAKRLAILQSEIEQLQGNIDQQEQLVQKADMLTL